jgi:ArsR family transcriptional regulator, arsenate/arsenite/antimonite-responsive transcriptional repressor
MSVDLKGSSAESTSEDPCCLPRQIPAVDRVRAERTAEVAKALSDPIRVQILDLLRSADGEVCQCEFQPLFDVSQPTMSHHLKKLAEVELIEVERRGKWAYYSMNPNALDGLRSWLS